PETRNRPGDAGSAVRTHLDRVARGRASPRRNHRREHGGRVMPTHKQVLEALLFASDAPIELATLVEILDGPSPEEVVDVLAELKREYESTERGVALGEI